MTDRQLTEDLLLDPEQAGQRLGISAWQVRKMCRDRELPAIRLGKYWRIRSSSLDQWIANQERAAR